ncbi:MAG: SgcJ/EcaC family oxidoreductase [Knoellia sp.]
MSDTRTTGSDPTTTMATIVTAWAEHDADAFADAFVEDGTMIISGSHVTSRPAIAEFMRAAFAGPYAGTRVTGKPIDVRSIAPGCTLIITEGGVILPGEEEVAPQRAIRAGWLLVQDEGTWRLAAYQNTPAHAPAA